MNAVSAGTGAMKRGDREQLVASWKRAADGVRRRARGLVEQLAALGIPVVKERDG